MAKEQELKQFNEEYDESKRHFLYYFKPEFDKAYKQFMSYTGDRAKLLEQTTEGEVWQSNVFIPQVFSYVKTFLQKTVGVTPDFKLEGNNAEALKDVLVWLWEIGMSEDVIDYFLQVFICGTTVGKDFLKKEVKKKREKDINVLENIKKLIFKTKTEKITYRPDFDPVDLYNFYPHPRMKKIKDNKPAFHRYVLTLDEAKAQYSDVPKKVWKKFVNKKGEIIKSGGDVTDYAYVRKEVLLETKKNLRETTTSSTPVTSGSTGNPQTLPESKETLFEIVERWVDERLVVFMPMNGKPVEIKDSDNPYDHGEKPYSRVVFFPRPFQFFGLGIPKLVDHLQELLNSVTNQRVDSVTMRIHSMIAAAPVALPGYRQSGITVRPLGILWTNDPNAVKELKFGDVNPSAYVEPNHIKEAMRIAVGVDEFSNLKGTDRKETATVASFMREATLEGVKLFLIMLRTAYIGHFEHWISMIQQFWTKKSVVPDKALNIINDYEVLSEEDENMEGVFDDEYELSLDSTSTLATSSELKKSKDLELWALIKDTEQFLDEETGKVYSVKKFKILMKLFEDYGWTPENYITEKDAPTVPPAPEGMNPEANLNINNTGEEIPVETPPAPPTPMPGQEMGAELGGGIR